MHCQILAEGEDYVVAKDEGHANQRSPGSSATPAFDSKQSPREREEEWSERQRDASMDLYLVRDGILSAKMFQRLSRLGQLVRPSLFHAPAT